MRQTREQTQKLTVRFPRALLQWARGEARRQDRSLNRFIIRQLEHRRASMLAKSRSPQARETVNSH